MMQSTNIYIPCNLDFLFNAAINISKKALKQKTNSLPVANVKTSTVAILGAQVPTEICSMFYSLLWAIFINYLISKKCYSKMVTSCSINNVPSTVTTAPVSLQSQCVSKTGPEHFPPASLKPTYRWTPTHQIATISVKTIRNRWHQLILQINRE